MEQFNLEEYLENSSRKVVTRDGHSVRIVCWDRLGSRPIIALVKGYDEDEEVGLFHKNGSVYLDANNNKDSKDLFFADEGDELTEFEKDLQIIISEASHWTSDDGSISTYCLFGNKEIKKISEQLLNLARKEILKDLPKWKKATNDREFNKHVLLFEDEKRVVLTTELYKGEYYIEVDDLETLPKEE